MMTHDKVQAICHYLKGSLVSERGEQIALSRDDGGNQTQHLNYMLQRIPHLIKVGRREKAMRWLGFVQGHMCAQGVCDIDEMKELNLSEGE